MPTNKKLVPVGHYLAMEEAELAAGLLENQGIKTVIQRSGAAIPGSGGQPAGADVCVDEADAERARELLG